MNKKYKKISIIFGTRPEAIKLAPVILTLKNNPDFKCHICVTAQHRQMLDQVLDVFSIVPDIDLNVMQNDQTLAELTALSIKNLDHYLAKEKPDLILVQGDTTTVFCAALTAFYHKVPVGHVEAGLRTGARYSPWPEEINRVLTTHLATIHFTPTNTGLKNLLREGISKESIHVTGNTVIDALFLALDKIKITPPSIPGISNDIIKSWDKEPMVLITGHRRENFGEGFESICSAILKLAMCFPKTHFVYPVHLNPHVQKVIYTSLSGHKNIHLLEPLQYLQFVFLMNKSRLILTDSGGIQEEAPSLGKPVLVMREVTERHEALEAGAVKLVGTDSEKIFSETSRLLKNDLEYSKMSITQNPYGDGNAAVRIAKICSLFMQAKEADS